MRSKTASVMLTEFPCGIFENCGRHAAALPCIVLPTMPIVS